MWQRTALCCVLLLFVYFRNVSEKCIFGTNNVYLDLFFFFEINLIYTRTQVIASMTNRLDNCYVSELNRLLIDDTEFIIIYLFVFCYSLRCVLGTIHRLSGSSTRRTTNAFSQWMQGRRSCWYCICCIRNKFAAYIQSQYGTVWWTRTWLRFWKRTWKSKYEIVEYLAIEWTWEHLIVVNFCHDNGQKLKSSACICAWPINIVFEFTFAIFEKRKRLYALNWNIMFQF